MVTSFAIYDPKNYKFLYSEAIINKRMKLAYLTSSAKMNILRLASLTITFSIKSVDFLR